MTRPDRPRQARDQLYGRASRSGLGHGHQNVVFAHSPLHPNRPASQPASSLLSPSSFSPTRTHHETSSAGSFLTLVFVRQSRACYASDLCILLLCCAVRFGVHTHGQDLRRPRFHPLARSTFLLVFPRPIIHPIPNNCVQFLASLAISLHQQRHLRLIGPSFFRPIYFFESGSGSEPSRTGCSSLGD